MRKMLTIEIDAYTLSICFKSFFTQFILKIMIKFALNLFAGIALSLLIVGFTQSTSKGFITGSYFAVKNNYCPKSLGELEISKITQDSFYFDITIQIVYNELSIHEGQIEGWAHIDDPNKASFYNNEWDEDWATEIEFYLTPDRKYILVNGIHTSPFHGAGTCFDGFYELNL